jgi:hypothetical protein
MFQGEYRGAAEPPPWLTSLAAREGGTNIKCFHTLSYSHTGQNNPKQTNTPHPPRTFLLSAQPSPLFTMNKYDPETDYMITPTTTIAESLSTMVSESPTTMIPESPTTNTGEIPILSVITGREDDSVFKGCQTEGRRYITRPNEVPLSAPLCEPSSLRQ